MCGIAAIFNIKEQTPALRNKALAMAKKIRHRGPDWSGIYCGGSAILAHERLSIVDPQSGGQPLYSPDRRQILAVNGEIYNHRDIRRRYGNNNVELVYTDAEGQHSEILPRETGGTSTLEEYIRRGVTVNSYRELMPRMNDIFIKLVTEGEEAK